MSDEFNKNIKTIKNIFKDKDDNESKYLAIINLGKNLSPLDSELKSPINKVDGCQSTTYLHTDYKDNVLLFKAESDALISAGLAALLIIAYNNLPPEVIINNPPLFIKDLNIHASLSPNRSNGLAQMYIRMKEDALKYL